MAATDSREFNFVSTPLGRTMFIEASAGTGKTWTLERLVLRFIVEEGVSVERFLIVTFTRAATGELSERVRKILKTALSSIAALEAEERGEAPSAGPDSSIRELWEKWKETGAGSLAQERIARAIEEFDRCAIHTIHSFCQKMMQAWAFSGGAPFGGKIGDGKQAERGAIEAWKRRWIIEFEGNPEAQRQVDEFSGGAFAARLLEHPGSGQALVFPEFQDAGGGIGGRKTFGDALRDFAATVISDIETRKEEEGIFTFDDIIRRMAAALDERPDFVRNVRDQFQAVLIDEFQDTDTLQYRIFSRLFLEEPGSGFRGAVFVGDPKQSIYAFRGAEIGVYLRARDEAKQRAQERDEAGVLTLSTNYRTTPAAVDAVNVLFRAPDGTSRFAPGIGCIPVKSSPERLPLFRRDPKTGALAPENAFEFWTQDWIAGGKGLPEEFKNGKYLHPEDRREAEAQLIANDVVRLLNSETYVGARLADPKVKTLEEARLKPGDIAVLVLVHDRASAVESELERRGVHCLHLRGNDVFKTAEARDVLSVMRALADPSNRTALNTARATPLCGRTLADIAGAEQGGAAGELWIEDLERFRRAAALCARRGFAAAMEMLFSEFRTTARVLGQKGGERALTNWEHAVELLHAEWEKAKSLPALIRWLERVMEAKDKDVSDDRKLRSESDASLVRVETVFAAKGLEYPVVYAAGAADAAPKTDRGDQAFLPGEDGAWRCYLSLKSAKGESKELKAEKEAAWAGVSAADWHEMTQKAYVWATRASARFAVPHLPSYRNYSGSLKFQGADSAWMRLIAPGALEKYHPLTKTGKVSKTLSAPEEPVVADRVNKGLEALEDRLLKESTFAGTAGSRLEMAEFLTKQAADAPEEKRAVMLEAAASLAALSLGESLAHVKTLASNIKFEEPPERLQLRGSAAEAVSRCLEAKPLLSDWRSSSYSSVTRGFELQAEAASAEKDPDEGYEETEPAEEVLLEADAPDPLSDPAFLAGGKDTGDAVHNVLEACVRRDLHREGGVAAEKWNEIFAQAFRAAPGSRLLGRKVRHPEWTPGADLTEEERKADDEAARGWLMDRAKGVFGSNWGTDGRPLFLSKSPPGCASPELPFSMRVKGGILSEDFAKRILEANAALPEGRRLPLAPLRVEGRDHSLRGYLEGRIDLLFEAEDGRFWIADWKTDQPGEKGRRRYDAAAMREVMVREKYGWQALFYLVAVMRMLSDGYGISKEEALEKLAGMAYVFVRGFSAAHPAADPAAVILEPAAELVLLADRLLEGEEEK